MLNSFPRTVAVAIILMLIISGPALADKPIQLALFNPAQIHPETESIRGLRINLIYGKNAALTGVDYGFFNILTKPSIGIQTGVVSINETDFSGYQANLVSITRNSFSGLQSGAYSYSKNMVGIQYGIVNRAEKMEGIQFGFVNITESMNGIQIGLINFIRQGGVSPVMPLINWSF